MVGAKGARVVRKSTVVGWQQLQPCLRDQSTGDVAGGVFRSKGNRSRVGLGRGCVNFVLTVLARAVQQNRAHPAEAHAACPKRQDFCAGEFRLESGEQSRQSDQSRAR